jgi:hypothetical protein
VLVPLVTSLTRVSAGEYFHHAAPTQVVFAGETTRWEPVARLPPVTYSTAQQTPLGEWPLVAAEVEARGHETERHQV